MSLYFHIPRWKGKFLFLGVFGSEKNLLVCVPAVRCSLSKLASGNVGVSLHPALGQLLSQLYIQVQT